MDSLRGTSRDLSFASAALNRSAELALSFFGKVTSTTKAGDNNQVLTEADLAIGRLLTDAISQTYPDDNIIDEELGLVDNGSDFTWVVDPIDGTSNFANGVPLYGIMLGLLVEDRPQMGGIILPSLGQLFLASRGGGAFRNGQPIRVTSESELKRSLVAYGIDGQVDRPELTRSEGRLLANIALSARNVRASNSAFDLMMVAQGSYGAYLMLSSKIWDNVAQHVILEEAGAVYTDFFGAPPKYDSPLSRAADNYTWCVAPPAIHEAIQAIISKEADLKLS